LQVASASGRAVGRFEAFLGLIGVLTLAITYSLLTGWNPVPGFSSWISSLSNVSDPAPLWNVRVGGQPHHAVAGPSAVLIIRDDYTESRDLATGTQRWRIKSHWAAAAGGPRESLGVVAIVGRSKGFDVYDLFTGVAIWHGEADAGAVWGYSNLIVSLSCKSDQCLLIGHSLNGDQRWVAKLPGSARDLSGANPGLAQLRPITAGLGSATSAMPPPTPIFMALPFANHVVVIDTSSGVQVRDVKLPDRHTRVIVVGTQLLTIKASKGDSGCRYTVRAIQAMPPGPVDQTTWQEDRYDWGTASKIGCDQESYPGGDGKLIRVSDNGQQMLLSGESGLPEFIAPDGAAILTATSTYAVVRDAGDRTISVYPVQGGAPTMTRAAGNDQDIALTNHTLLVADHPERRFYAYEIDTGRELINVKTRGTMLGYGEVGILLSEGRSIGYLPYGQAG